MINSFVFGAGGGGGDVTPLVGRYFFIEFLTTGNGYIGCSTISCFDSGGTDHALQANGGVASAVGYTVNGSFPVTNVNDGNDTSFTTSDPSSTGSGKGIQIDLGSVESIERIAYRSRSDGFGVAEAILTGNVYYKVNSGDAWTLAQAVDEVVWTAAETREWYFIDWTPSSTGWSIMVKSTNGLSATAREVQFRETSGGADTTSGGTATASTTSGGTPANAFDDNSGTSWGGANGEGRLTYTHASAKTIREFTWQIDTNTGASPAIAAVAYLNSFGGWTTWWRPPTMTWTASETKTLTKT